MKNDKDIEHVPQHGQSKSYSAYVILCLLATLLTACSGSGNTTSASKNGKSTRALPTNNGIITYSTNPNDVIVRTFYGGGNFGTLAFSPEMSIYGDGRYILGPGLQMREGRLDTDSLQQLLHALVDADGLLSFTQTQFYDVPDQNATLLQLTLKHPYSNATMTVLVHQDFSPDLTQNIPVWPLPDFTLSQLAIFECGIIPPDQVGPNGDTGCLTFTVPRVAYLPNRRQIQTIRSLLNNQQQGEFLEQGLYYRLVMRPLLPDELPLKTVAMLGSNELSYKGVPLQSGPIP